MCYDIVAYILRYRRSSSCSKSVSTTISCTYIVVYIVYDNVNDIGYDMGCNKVHYTCITCTIKHCSLLWQLVVPHACTWWLLLHVSCCLQVASCSNLQSRLLRSRVEMFARSATSRCWSWKDASLFHCLDLNLQLPLQVQLPILVR